MVAGGFDNENDYFDFIRFLYEEEPIFISFNPTSAFLKIFVYCNNQTFDVFNDLLVELNNSLDDFHLLEKGYQDFYVREASPLIYADQYNKCWECISINRNNCMFLSCHVRV